MRNIDFISNNPQLTIFKQGANQTSFGGILFLVYTIILILLSIVYIIDYSSQDDYVFEYTYIQEPYGKQTIPSNDENINPYYKEMTFLFSLIKDVWEEAPYLSNNFILVDLDKLSTGYTFSESIITLGKYYKRKIDRFRLGVFYKCDGTNCTIREDDKIKVDSYHLIYYFRGYDIIHQSPDEPIKLIDENYFIYKDVQFLENTNIIYANWEFVQYDDKKGTFGKFFDNIRGKSNSHYGVKLESFNYFTDDGHMKNLPDTAWNMVDEQGNHFITLLYLENYINRDYSKYSRTGKSIITVLSNIAALGSTILNLMSLAYRFLYSRSFENYKIVENIITKRLRLNINQKKTNSDSEAKIELKKDLLEIKEENDNEKENLDNENNNDIGEETQVKNTNENIDLPVPHFHHFLFNKLYLKCFGPSSEQHLIGSCNDIVAKYIAIERIIYNQMKLENLWRDYKWNNPEYEIKEKNDLILDLKD